MQDRAGLGELSMETPQLPSVPLPQARVSGRGCVRTRISAHYSQTHILLNLFPV